LDTGEKVILDMYCPAYDAHRRECMIYDWRQTEEARQLRGGTGCIGPEDGMRMSVYPKTCAYVRKGSGYNGLCYDPARLALVPLGALARVRYYTMLQHAAIRKELQKRKEASDGKATEEG
jgi:hypothetical protein